jgi:hypothetical protein
MIFRQRKFALCAAVAATALCVSGAAANTPSPSPGPVDPCATVNGQTAGTAAQGSCDTWYTPVAKDGFAVGWHQVEGAVFPGLQRNTGDSYQSSDSAVPDTVDFYTVSFPAQNEHVGLAGGAECIGPPPPLAQLESCRRVPVIYSYTVDDQGKGTWKQVYGPDVDPADTQTGFVGAIAWLGPGKALAVGGDGCFPNREDVPCPPADQTTNATDPYAGNGRAWQLQNGSWSEISNQLPPGTTGMTALDASPRPGDCNQAASDCAFAGGYREIVEYSSDRFVHRFAPGDPNVVCPSDAPLVPSPPTGSGNTPPVSNPVSGNCGDWLFRVRAIKFAPGSTTQPLQAVAVTSGCCDPNAYGPANDVPRVLEWDGSQWHVGLLYDQGGGISDAQTLPNSYYAVTFSSPDTNCGECISVLASPGGPEAPGEPASRLVGPVLIYNTAGSSTNGIDLSPSSLRGPGIGLGGGQTALCALAVVEAAALPNPGDVSQSCTDLATNAASPDLSSVRLVSGDGDQGGTPAGARAPLTGSTGAPDGLMDWAVGELLSSENNGLPGEGVAYTTTVAQNATSADLNPTTCNLNDSSSIVSSPTCVVNSQAAQQESAAVKSAALLGLTSYALNSFQLLPSGTGWAVGDLGAIDELGGSGSDASAVSSEPKVPPLGSHAVASLPDRSAYDPYAVQLTATPGQVPPLDAQPFETRSSGQLVPGGSPDPARPSSDLAQSVAAMVMSRDGSEGWAVGPDQALAAESSATTTLYHYIDGRWEECQLAPQGPVPADPACASLAELPLYGDQRTPVKIEAIARVPLELGSDPSRANDFEAVAVGSAYSTTASQPPRHVVLTYEDGRWSIDTAAMRQLDPSGAHAGDSVDSLAFATPTDGWLVMSAAGSNYAQIAHYDGQRWTLCGSDQSSSNGVGQAPLETTACDDAQGDTSADTQPLLPLAEPLTVPLQVTTAGTRVYLYGERIGGSGAASPGGSNAVNQAPTSPLILYRDSGPCDPSSGQTSGCWRSDTGGYDPGGPSSNDPSQQGCVYGLSIVQNSDGSYTGWAIGQFSNPCESHGGVGPVGIVSQPQTQLLHLSPSGWSPWTVADASSDYQLPATYQSGPPSVVLAMPDGHAFIAPGIGSLSPSSPMLSFDPVADSWTAFGTPFTMVARTNPNVIADQGNVDAVVSDGNEGFWMAARGIQDGAATWFYHYTTSVHRPVFTDVPQPIRERITATATAPDGSFWVATASSALYRYDRETGWDRVAVPGWLAGALGTGASSGVRALAIGPDGTGLAVGDGGRIADIGPSGAVLDAAAGVACSQIADRAPCSTGHSLDAVAVASDGSGAALAGGDDTSLLWRPAGEAFRAIPAPQMPGDATITSISMPTATSAWLATSSGDIFAGQLGSNGWSWTNETIDSSGNPLAVDADGRVVGVRAVSVNASGSGWAVGDRGLIIERVPGASPVWQRVDPSILDNLDSLAVSPDGHGVLIGGDNGLVLTLADGHFAVARPADAFDPLAETPTVGSAAAKVVGVAIVPGERAGEVEAWAAEQSQDGRVSAILHYSSDPTDPLLDAGTGRAVPLPDVPAPVPREIAMAVFGNSACQVQQSQTQLAVGSLACPEMTGSNLVNEVIASRLRDEVISASHAPGGPQFALFTGDVSDAAGAGQAELLSTPLEESVAHHRWVDLIARPLLAAGVPVFGAIGGEDLSYTQSCPQGVVNCASTDSSKAGPNIAWRHALSAMPAPWGAAGNAAPPVSHGLSFVPVQASGEEGVSASVCPNTVSAAGQTVTATNQACTASVPGVPVPSVTTPVPSPVPAPTGTPAVSQQVPSESVSTAGAHTHYAFDVERDGKPVLRVVVVDTSLKTLSVAAGEQNPIESQLKWLSDVLSGRPQGEKAVVVSETPSYSYGPGFGTDTLTDSAAFETLMGTDHVSAVISGRLGWNGLYYTSTTAAGLHCPQAGGSYPDPSTGCSPTAPAGSGAAEQQALQTAGAGLAQVASALSGLGAPSPPPPNNQLGAYPTVIAASAGGPFGPADQPSTGSASQGYWHGYSILRLLPNGSVVVEQRPVFDWIGISALSHNLEPGQHMQLNGYGREPVGIDQPVLDDTIDSPAITHRYDLVEADPNAPYLPKLDASGNYVPLDPSVATVNQQTGFIQTGSGSHPLVYALAILSVGDKAATYPIAFEPSKSYPQPKPILSPLPSLEPPAPLPAVHVAAAAPTPPPPPNSAPPTPPEVGTPSLPTLPTLAPPPPVAGPSSPTPPPPPPAPPPPPSQPTPLPLALQARLAPIGINATVVPPSPPPVNPAPPSGSGARKEAKQRQAATAKSEQGAEEGVNPQDAQAPVNTVGDRNQSAATRRDTTRPLNFTAVVHRDQPSAWSRDLLYGGGLGMAALVLALGFVTVRPTARRRQPPVPAPARVWNRRG